MSGMPPTFRDVARFTVVETLHDFDRGVVYWAVVSESSPDPNRGGLPLAATNSRWPRIKHGSGERQALTFAAVGPPSGRRRSPPSARRTTTIK